MNDTIYFHHSMKVDLLCDGFFSGLCFEQCSESVRLWSALWGLFYIRCLGPSLQIQPFVPFSTAKNFR